MKKSNRCQNNPFEKAGIKIHTLRNTSTRSHAEIEREERKEYSIFVRTKLFEQIMELKGTNIYD